MEKDRRPAEGAGPECQLASDDPSSSPTAKAPQPDPIAAMRPWEPEDRLYQRRRLHRLMLDGARLAQRARSPRAKERFWAVNADAAAYLWDDVQTDALEDIATALCREMMAAQAFERVEGGYA